MKKPIFILLFLCSAVMACNGENPIRRIWRGSRLVEARVGGAKWQPYRAPANLRTRCDETINSRDGALDLLAIAGGDCLDKAVRAVERYAHDDVAAAWLTRFERRGDPIDLLHAWKTATGFNRALALEKLQLNREAIAAWDAVVRERSAWSDEARARRDRLSAMADPMDQWNKAAVDEALRRRDRAALLKIASAFPFDAAQYFERCLQADTAALRMFAEALASAGEHYPRAILAAIERKGGREALEQAIQESKQRRYERAAAILERAGNPFHLSLRFHAAYNRYDRGEESLPLLDAIVPHLRPEYREFGTRVHMMRATVQEYDYDNYLAARAAYEAAIKFAKGEPTATAAIFSRRSQNHATVGMAEEAFRDAYEALKVLQRVTDINARHQSYGAAAMAVRALALPRLAMYYQSVAVDVTHKAAGRAPALDRKVHLATALRGRADLHIELGDDESAARDLEEAAELAEAIERPEVRDQLRMRILEIRGQMHLKSSPAQAVDAFTDAIAKAELQHATYRAVLHFKRAAARVNAREPDADRDIDTALRILRNEAKGLIDSGTRGQYEDLWTPYFSRFQAMEQQMIESRIAAGDPDGAFVYAELARALEPLQLLMQSKAVPAGFRPIESKDVLREQLNAIPDDTVILQYAVLPEGTYTWVLTRGRIAPPVRQRATRRDVEGMVASVMAAVQSSQPDAFTRAMRAAYAELFREPLRHAPASARRIVIIPDGPMAGLPFNALQGTRQEGYLIERASIATDASTSLYLYALARDRRLSAPRTPSVLLIGDPAIDRRLGYARLHHARAEVTELAARYYRGAKVLLDREATVRNFLAAAKDATIIHFAGHGVANPHEPSKSRLLFSPEHDRSGELTADTLLRELPELARTRLVVLGACSSAGGAPVGPQGLAPLVRPLIAASVTAVVSALWEVRDATTKHLLVFLHCHYRHGDDVAVALRNAQLAMLRNDIPAMKWAAFQVIGHAGSPYPRPIALENNHNDHVCIEDSFLGADGPHSQ